ncbi:Pimeloyl-ACP methyl ester carboxylesterase [Azospirillaceae bacterium]
MVTPVERSYLSLNPVGFHRVCYMEWGASTAERTVVCVHGLTRNGRDFDVLAGGLAEAGWRVICPDVAGRGRSDWLLDGSLYNYAQYLSDMVVLLARLDVETVDWVGTSMGGIMGMLLASKNQTPIRRLVLNDVGPFVPKAALDRIADYIGVEPVFEDLAALKSYIRYLYQGFGALTEEQWDDMARSSARLLPDGRYGLAFDPKIGQVFKDNPVVDVNLWAVWDAMRCSVLTLRGERSDLLLSETAEEMTRRGPGTKLVEIEGAGHAPGLMASDQIKAILRFLQE